MANGLSDILSAYRQGLASERQTRQAEMSVALQAMQFEAQQRFREEGRQREDIMGALDYAKQSTTQAMGQDASQIYTKISSLRPIVEAGMDAETGALLKTDKIINALSKPTNKKGQYGFTPAQATEIVNIANTYAMAAKNPLLAQSAQDLAVSFGRKVTRDYDIYESTGFTQSSKFIKSLEKSGLLYKGPDPMQRDMSADVFLGVSDAVTALDNIDKERMEIAKGDYKVDTPITVSGVAQDTDISGMDFAALADKAGVSLGLGPGAESGPALDVDLGAVSDATDAEVLQELDFLEDDEIDLISNKLASISDEIAKKKALLEPLTEKREASIQTYSQAQEDYEKAQKRYSYMSKRGFRDKAKKARNEMQKLDSIIRDSEHTKEVRSAPGGISYEGTISDKMTPILIAISRLEKEKERLGR